MKKEDIERMLTKIQQQGRGLTKWETDFIASITEQFEERGSLSPRQLEIVEKIYADKTAL